MGKRIFGLVMAVGALVGAMAFLRGGSSENRTLRLCSWSNYFPEGYLAEFTRKTGIKVELSFFSSNEELFAKLKAGANGYDLILPSDYMVGQMIRLNMLAPIDHSLLTHLKHLDPYYLNLSYDPGLKYSIPFTRGSTGIAVNTEKVPLPSGEVGWDILFNSPDPQRTSLMDDMREAFAAVLLSEGKPINTKDEAVLAHVKARLSEIKNHIALFSSEPLPLLVRGDITIAHVFSTHGVLAARENPKIKYFIPKEGGVVWTDNFAIPKTTTNTEHAHLFLNYFLDPANALSIAEQNHLATPNRTGRARLPKEDRESLIFYPPAETLSRMFFLEDIGASMPIISRMWTDIKS